MKQSFIAITLGLLIAVTALAQTDGVLIDYAAGTRDNTAVFQLNSTAQGFLVPRVDLDNATAPIAAAKPTGLLVYNIGGAIGPDGFYYWDGTAWVMLLSQNGNNSSGWLTSGNSATTQPTVPVTYGTSTFLSGENFVGTTDAKDFVLGTTNIERLRVLASNGSVGIGTTAPGSKLDVRSDALAVTQDDTKGISVSNSTAAAAGVAAQQISPPVRWLGNGWATTPVASQSVEFIADVLPVQGTSAPSATWRIGSSINNGAYSYRMVVTSGGFVGIGSTAPSAQLQVVSSQSSNAARVSINNALTISNTSAGLTATRLQSGIQNTVTNAQTSALTGAWELNEYGINNLLTQTTANSKMTNGYGAQNRVLQNIATGTITNAYGDYNQVYNQAGTISGNAWASYNQVSSNGNTTADVRGSYNYLTVNGGTYTNAYAQRNFIERTTGTITNAYGTYTSFSGTMGTKWGSYITGEDKNYFSGSVGIGDDTPVSPLTVGTGDLFQVASNGDIVKIKNLTYSWPTGYGGGGTFLQTDASGNLTWAAALTSEVDGSITNEGTLTVGIGTATTSTITSNTSGSTAVTLTAGVGLVNSESGNTITTAFDYAATLSSEPTGATLGANQTVMGSNGLIFEGSTAELNEGFLTVANPTADRIWTLPNASGTVAVSATAPIAVSAAGDVSFAGWPTNATGVLANNGSGTLSWTSNGTTLLTAGNDIDFGASATNSVDLESTLNFVHTIIAPSANNLLLQSQTGRDMTFQTNGANTRMTIASAGTVGVNIPPHADRMLSSQTATTTADGAAIWGSATGNGRVYGVYGSIASATDNAAGVRGFSAGAGNVYGLFGEATSSGTTFTGAGTRGLITGTGYGLRGVYAQNQATGAGAQYGLFAEKTGATGTGTGYGVYGSATGTAATNYGGYFTSSGATNNYGLIVPSGGGNVGFGTITPQTTLHVNGNSAQINNTVWGWNSLQVAPGSTTYYKIATLPISTSGTYDHIVIDGVLDDNWGSNQKAPFKITLGNRNAFSYFYDLYGSLKSNARIVAYREADQSVSVYLYHASSTYTSISCNISNSIQATVYPNPSPTTVAPTGTLVFDSYTTNPRFIIDNAGNVGIGTNAPVAKLEVAGQVKITGGSPGAGKVLTSDATGLATWATPSGTTQRTVFADASDYVFYSDAYITFRWQASGDDVQLAAQTGHTGWWDYTYWGESHDQILPNSGDHGSDDIDLTTAWTDFYGTSLFDEGDSEYGGGITIFVSKENSNAYPTYKLEVLRHGTYVTSLVTVYY